MRHATPRIEYAVPPTLEKRLEATQALRALVVQDDERLQQRQAVIAALRRDLETLRRDCGLLAQGLRQACRKQVLADLQAKLKRYNPDEPRVPAGNPHGGQWTTEGGNDSSTDQGVASDVTPTDNAVPGAQYAANDPPGIGHNQGPPLDEPPEIPPQEPATAQLRNAFLKAAARWLAKAALEATFGGLAGDYLVALQTAAWLYKYLPYIVAYLQPPKTLDELQQDALNPQPGYDIHHVVERTSAKQDGFPNSMINAPDNLVRIPTLKHWQINAWYSTKNDDFGDLSPRDFLRGKSWDERNSCWNGRIYFVWSARTVTESNLSDLRTEELVDRFAIVGVEQDGALLRDEIAEFNRLYDKKVAITNELKRRPGDQRRALLALFDHPNMQTRLNAAKATLVVAPQAARQMLQAIASSRWYPQAGDAGMCLVNLDRGIFVPK